MTPWTPDLEKRPRVVYSVVAGVVFYLNPGNKVLAGDRWFFAFLWPAVLPFALFLGVPFLCARETKNLLERLADRRAERKRLRQAKVVRE